MWDLSELGSGRGLLAGNSPAALGAPPASEWQLSSIVLWAAGTGLVGSLCHQARANFRIVVPEQRGDKVYDKVSRTGSVHSLCQDDWE